MAMFSEWLNATFKIPASKCSPVQPCPKFGPSICESTFEDFTNVDKNLIPAFDKENLLDYIEVENTLGGGKSGAYLFKIRLKRNNRKTDGQFVLKLYATAYNSLGRVQDTRPFREVYTQCAMSGSSGYNCLLGFARAPWSSVDKLFAKTTKELYDDKLKRNPKLADVRMIDTLPASVLFMICTFSKGTPLLNLDLNEFGEYMPGIVLNIISTHQKAERRLGHFTHWDLHADNIFVDTECENRPPIPVAFIGNFDPSWILTKLRKIPLPEYTPPRSPGWSFETSLWDPTVQNMRQVIANYKETGEIVQLNDFTAALDFCTNNEIKAVRELSLTFDKFINRLIYYPTVTLIDFDLANSDEFPKLDRIHQGKLTSPLPVAERTLTWLLKWIPSSHVIQLTQLLLTVRPLIVAENKSDIIHMLVYMFVALIYWDLPELPALHRLARLHEKSNHVFAQVAGFLSTAPKLTNDVISEFFFQNIKSVLPIKCEAPTYCGLSPLLAIDFTNWNTAAIGAIQSFCPEGTSCTNLISPTKLALKGTAKTISDLIRVVHGSLLELNIENFSQKRKFLTSDDVELTFNHIPQQDQERSKLYIHVEVPWEDIVQKFNLTYVKGLTAGRYTNGRISFGCNMTDTTTVSIQLKNGSDLMISVASGIEFQMHGLILKGRPGTQYRARVSHSPFIVVDGNTHESANIKNLIFSIVLKSAKITIVGSLTQISLHLSITTQLTSILSGFIQYIILNILKTYLSDNIVMSTSDSNIYIVLSMPPSDEPIHPCVGFAMDSTNITHALNCLSSFFSMPTLISKVFKSVEDDAKPVLRSFLNQIIASIGTKDTFLPIWSMTWTADGPMKGVFVLNEISDDLIREALENYLRYYKGIIPQNTPLPALAVPIYSSLPDLSDWIKVSTDASSFNINYVKYLASFLTKEEEFHDAEAGAEAGGSTA